MSSISHEPMMDMFIFETVQLLEQLEQDILIGEKSSSLDSEAINEIFRIMHTIKGSSAMMMFNNIATLAHALEDLFYCLREDKPSDVDYSELTDLVLESADFIKLEIEKIDSGIEAQGNADEVIEQIKEMLKNIKKKNSLGVHGLIDLGNKEVEIELDQKFYIGNKSSKNESEMNFYRATIFFEDGCEMENIRAFTIVHDLKEIVEEIHHWPLDVIDDEKSIELIRQEGFKILISTVKNYESIHKFFMETIFLKDLKFEQLEDEREFLNQHILKHEEIISEPPTATEEIIVKSSNEKETQNKAVHQSLISVNVDKLDILMDLVGEIVVAEAMVLENLDLKGLHLESFNKAGRHLEKITSELQNIVMSIRMLPLSITFQKMNRLVRDMSKKLNKEVQLKLIGEDTEVDKNVIEHISDPLMHLVRNSIDHGIEDTEDRESCGKSRVGTITLEAKNIGSDVVIFIKDDGRGLNREKILNKAKEQGLLYKPEKDMTDKEIYNLIALPGFSTKDNVSEFSGRGVGMDVVTKNIEKIGGSVTIDSSEGFGSIITLKIPLTLAIIDGMNISVGKSRYTIPVNAIKESFRPKDKDIIKDPDGNEMIMVRGQCYSIFCIYKYYKVKTEITDFTKGILIMVEQGDKTICVFADELLGQQQVVVKALPDYIKKIKGLSGCTILGDGSISLILDINSFIGMDNVKFKGVNIGNL